MKTTLSCEIVRDLLPSYIENLTSEKSTEEIKAHLDTCPQCRALLKEMTSGEPEPEEVQPEIDYLKKVKLSKRRIAVLAVCAVLVTGLAAGAIALILRGKAKTLSAENGQLTEAVDQLSEENDQLSEAVDRLSEETEQLRTEAEMPTVLYNETTKALIVSGTKDYDRIEIPKEAKNAVTLDVQDDEFHLSVHVQLLRGASEAPETFLPAYIQRTKLGLRFVREYLKENAPSVYSATDADKMVDLTIRKGSTNVFLRQADRIEIYLGSNYWHREFFYLLAMMNCKEIEWKQIGYGQYVNLTLNPYNEIVAMNETFDETNPYYQMLVNAGADPEHVTPDTLRLQNDIISRFCLERGLTNWGSPYESAPVKEVQPFTKTARTLESEANSEMSALMAASFIARLVDLYDFDTVSRFCFGKKSFEEAFGTDFAAAFEAWKVWIIETYPIA